MQWCIVFFVLQSAANTSALLSASLLQCIKTVQVLTINWPLIKAKGVSWCLDQERTIQSAVSAVAQWKTKLVCTWHPSHSASSALISCTVYCTCMATSRFSRISKCSHTVQQHKFFHNNWMHVHSENKWGKWKHLCHFNFPLFILTVIIYDMNTLLDCNWLLTIICI